jgi:glycosyltransferase involved in cell wall biosynthesis
MNDIYLTVVVSTYNQEHYIAECLESIVANLPDKHCEVIVANDCSTDGTADVVDEFVGRYPFIRHLYREKNVGANLNYLDAHQQAQGKYVAHFDGDDVVRPGKFTQQIAVMDQQSDVNIVFHAAEYFSDDRSLILHTGILHQDQPVWYFDEQQYASWGPIAVHSSYMYRRKSLDLKNIVVPFMEWQIAMATLQNCESTIG